MADPALKLFGRTIQLGDVGSSSSSDLNPSCENKEKNNENRSGEDRETVPAETEQNSTSSLNMNLPCPRCNSLDTKFCYYNHYNVNQPRHFCKNCQRYWTAGGTIYGLPKEKNKENRSGEDRETEQNSTSSMNTNQDNDQQALSNNRPEREKPNSMGADNPQKKGLKKADKTLPCPRCRSLDTKFCYYNNNNVKQPRHFCKNCQRYWTADGIFLKFESSSSTTSLNEQMRKAEISTSSDQSSAASADTLTHHPG